MKIPLDSQSLIVVKMECASFKWDSKKEKHILSNINIMVSKGSLVIVVGKVGAGKSSLIVSLLGEIPKLIGMVFFSP
jgi:ABC-type Mn2+/Zn2+ transport system ATPase subunit